MNSTAAKTRPTETLVSLAPAPSGAGVDILALTEDDLFLLTARKVVKLPNRIWHATSDTQAADILLSTPCAAVLADITLVQVAQLPAIVKRLREQFPDLAFVVTGEPEHESEVAPLIESGEVQSFIAKQNAPRQLASALQLGVDRHFELHAETRPAVSRRGRYPVLFGIAAGVLAALALVAVAVWLMMNGDRQGAVPQPVFRVDGAGQPSAASSAAVEQALQNARDAFEAGRYSASGNNNDALDHYRAALALDPANAEAKDGLSRISEIMLARTELALVEGDMREASDHLKSARAIDPSNPRITFLEAQISRETERSASAREETQRIEELNRKLEELRKAPPAPAPAPVQVKAPPPPVIEPATEAPKPAEIAAAPAKPTPADIQAQLLSKAQPLQQSMIRKHVEPVYPSRARREGTEGYVDLRITVSKAGDVKDVQVSGAEPKGLFDDAAVTAAKRWKIEPKKIDGETYEQLLAVKLRFRLEK